MKFNNLLESYRKDVLPLIYLNYDTLSDNENWKLYVISSAGYIPGRECKLFSFKKSPIKARNGP
jgi:hypothetical protein